MQTKFMKYSLLLLLTVHTAVAQQPSQQHRVAGKHYIISTDESGKKKETVSTVIDNTSYQLILVNDKLTELYVDDKLVPPDQYSRYEEIVQKIKEQLRIDRIQAEKDQQRAIADQKKAKTDQEQAMKDQIAAKLQQEKAEKDQRQAKLDQENAMKDQTAVKLQQEKAAKDQQQAKLDQEQAMKDQAIAKIDEERAKEDQRLMKQLISDLVKDGIVTDEKSIQSIKMSSTELLVNDKKQPEDVYLKYKAKYPRFATANFSYEGSAGGNKTMHMHQ